MDRLRSHLNGGAERLESPRGTPAQAPTTDNEGASSQLGSGPAPAQDCPGDQGTHTEEAEGIRVPRLALPLTRPRTFPSCCLPFLSCQTGTIPAISLIRTELINSHRYLQAKLPAQGLARRKHSTTVSCHPPHREKMLCHSSTLH